MNVGYHLTIPHCYGLVLLFHLMQLWKSIFSLVENFNLTLNHYSYIGLPARHYNSFDELGQEMGNSRPFGGIHYQTSCDKGFWLGKKVSQNILSRVKFLKE
jgi:hypothetical protein